MSCASAPLSRGVQPHPAALRHRAFPRRSRCRSPARPTRPRPGPTRGSPVSNAGTGPARPVLLEGVPPGQPRRGQRIAPCSLSSSSGGIVVDPVDDLGGRGSVAARLALLLVGQRSVRRLRISSISVPSNRSPGLSGAISGWSYRMIGEDSIGVVAVADQHRPGALVLAPRPPPAAPTPAVRASTGTAAGTAIST